MKLILLIYRFVNDVILLILHFKFTILSIFLFFYTDLISAIIATISGFMLDRIMMVVAMIYSNRISLRNLLKDTAFLKAEQSVECFEEINMPLIEDIENYYAKYNKIYTQKRKKNLFFTHPRVRSAISYPFTKCKSIILIPQSFIDDFKSKKIIIAHEFSHAISHDYLRATKVSFLSFSFISLLFSMVCLCVFNTSSFLVISLIYSLFIIYYSKYSFETTSEMEANLDALRYIEDVPQSDIQHQDNAYVLLLYRYFSLQQIEKYCPKYVSELNQIKFLLNFITKENKNRFLKSVEKYRAELRHEVLSKKNKIQISACNNILLYNSKNINGISGTVIGSMSFSCMLLTVILMFFLCCNISMLLQSFVFSLNWIYAIMVVSGLALIYVCLIIVFLKLCIKINCIQQQIGSR